MTGETNGAPKLPAHASVVVVGGGALGCSVLYHLVKEGATDAVLLERNQITSGTTWHSAAQVRALRSGENMTRLVRHSIGLYARLHEETGQSAGWQNTGSISIACSPGRLTHLRRQEGLANLYGVRARPMDVGEIRERWPLINAEDIIGATWSPDDGRAGPSDLCRALIKGAKNGGAKVLENTAVVGIQTRGGKICGVETAGGAVRCDAAVICAGLWSREIAAAAGVCAPLWPCEHFYLLTMPDKRIPRGLPTLSDHDSHLYLRDDSGGMLVGAFEPHARAVSPERLGDKFAFQLLPEDWEHFSPMMENAVRRVPLLAEARAKTLINGPESFTPDGMFVLGETAETEGLFLACGMNSVGIATAGGAGFALAKQIATGRMPFALMEAAPSRFSACWNSAAALAARAPEVLGRHYEISYPHPQMQTARNLRETPLHAVWQKNGAEFGQYGGWERPLFFNKTEAYIPTFARPAWHAQTGAEVLRAHNAAAVFDLSPLGKILASGADAEQFLNYVFTNNMRRPPGRAVYSLMLDECGGILADITAHRLNHENYFIYTGADTVRFVLAWMKRHARGMRVNLSDETEKFAVLALCGAEAAKTAAGAGLQNIINLPYFHCMETTVGGKHARAARLSYTGEYGWEITCAAADAAAVYAALADNGAAPAGMFAQTSMRIEKRFLACGHDMDADLTPLECGLEFAVDWESSFLGKDALLARKKEGVKKFVAAVVLEDENAVPIGGETVHSAAGEIVGKTTSAAFGFRLQKPVAAALLKKDAGEKVFVNIAGEMFAAKTCAGAPFDPAGRRMKSAPEN